MFTQNCTMIRVHIDHKSLESYSLKHNQLYYININVSPTVVLEFSLYGLQIIFNIRILYGFFRLLI